MIKPLTIEELQALPVGDWIYVQELGDEPDSFYAYKTVWSETKNVRDVFLYYHHKYRWGDDGLDVYDYAGYGTKWVAYKNKEQAQAAETSEEERQKQIDSLAVIVAEANRAYRRQLNLNVGGPDRLSYISAFIYAAGYRKIIEGKDTQVESKEE